VAGERRNVTNATKGAINLHCREIAPRSEDAAVIHGQPRASARSMERVIDCDVLEKMACATVLVYQMDHLPLLKNIAR